MYPVKAFSFPGGLSAGRIIGLAHDRATPSPRGLPLSPDLRGERLVILNLLSNQAML